jgi:hypothetical protein
MALRPWLAMRKMPPPRHRAENAAEAPALVKALLFMPTSLSMESMPFLAPLSMLKMLRAP